jgi:hypothetical protein
MAYLDKDVGRSRAAAKTQQGRSDDAYQLRRNLDGGVGTLPQVERSEVLQAW